MSLRSSNIQPPANESCHGMRYMYSVCSDNGTCNVGIKNRNLKTAKCNASAFTVSFSHATNEKILGLIANA